ncbi:MAG: ABC transporter permease [Dactylosporangium sp.]|nr:ABC transporter permease [Dactylosporangium sp.]NNJ60450.1 ABC transporter permease [Dactylosporangium sp.]
MSVSSDTRSISVIRARFSAAGLPTLGAASALLAWWTATTVFNVSSFFLPSPADIMTAFRKQPEYLLRESWVTMTETLIGFGIAAASGLLIAMVLTASSVIQRATLPLLVALNSIPKVAIAPLLVVWMGFGQGPKITLVLLICFFPVVVSTMSGLTSTPADFGELARSLSASWWRVYFKVRLPWALPQIFVGLKVAISLAVIGAVVAEISNPDRGLGSVIVLSGQSFDTPLAFTALVLLALMSVMLFYVICAVERLLLPWARAISA